MGTDHSGHRYELGKKRASIYMGNQVAGSGGRAQMVQSSLRMKLRSVSPWQGARGWLMWIQLPAALLAVLAPEGLEKHSTDLEKSMSAWA